MTTALGDKQVTEAQLEAQMAEELKGSKLADKSIANTGRHLFVTVGSTASFRPLLEAVIKPDFINAIKAMGFASMVVQTGTDDYAWFQEQLEAMGAQNLGILKGLRLSYCNYVRDMKSEFLQCRSLLGERLSGVVISHGGALGLHLGDNPTTIKAGMLKRSRVWDHPRREAIRSPLCRRRQ